MNMLINQMKKVQLLKTRRRCTLKPTKLRRINLIDAKDLYSSTEISNAKRTITELINEETNTFHGDDMEKPVQCMFKCINVNTK